jgi:hypothetical protein
MKNNQFIKEKNGNNGFRSDTLVTPTLVTYYFSKFSKKKSNENNDTPVC